MGEVCEGGQHSAEPYSTQKFISLNRVWHVCVDMQGITSFIHLGDIHLD